MSITTSKCFILTLVAILLSGCATLPGSKSRYAASDRTAAINGFAKSFVKANPFILTSYYKIRHTGKPLRIYIEGDGDAWISKTQISKDPTPIEPIVLRLASIDPAENIAYIARPGQYAENRIPGCDPSYWSGRRFSSEVIKSVNNAIDQLLTKSHSNKIELIGYSGGAAVAVLITAQRTDVMNLRTIAGNLNPEAVNRYHDVSLLEGSLNPIDVAYKIKDLPQRHFVGSKDDIVPLFIAQYFIKCEDNKNDNRITVVEGATHTKGWIERWGELLSLPFY
jgi:hypothetical protein